MTESPEPFHYRGSVSEPDVREREISVRAVSIETVSRPSLVGAEPTIRFRHDEMILISTSHETSLVKWCSFRVGDVIVRAARVGDLLEVGRSALGGIRLSVFRSDRLLVAVGALACRPLGSAVYVRGEPGRRPPTRRYLVQIGDVQCELGARESAAIAGYDVYLDRPGHSFVPESLSIVANSDPVIVNSARRSAVVMGMDDDYFAVLRGERIDGTFIRNRSGIP